MKVKRITKKFVEKQIIIENEMDAAIFLAMIDFCLDNGNIPILHEGVKIVLDNLTGKENTYPNRANLIDELRLIKTNLMIGKSETYEEY